MPRCYMVKKEWRQDRPWPYSPTEACVAPPCYSPNEESTAKEEKQLISTPISERSAAETEAAHELLSLAQGLPPAAPTAYVTLVHSDNQNPHLLSYSIQPTNIYVVTNDKNINECHTVRCDSDIPLEYCPDPSAKNYTNLETEVSSIVPERKESVINYAPSLLSSKSLKSRKTHKYECLDCGKCYATSSNLSRHMQTHLSLDSLEAKRCIECGKAYVSMPALSMHLLTHSKGHACNICGKQFSRPWLLRGHERSHTGEKPYQCLYCNKAFADRSNLRAHQQTHSEVKRYTCERCCKTFALKSYLTKHQESSNCVRTDND